MALSNKDLPKPIRRKQVVDIEGFGEFIVQALPLTDRLALQMKLHADAKLQQADVVHWILHRSVINPDGTPFWAEAEWQDFGSSLDGSLACTRLYAETQNLFIGGEKKDSKANSDSPSGSASPSAEP